MEGRKSKKLFIEERGKKEQEKVYRKGREERVRNG